MTNKSRINPELWAAFHRTLDTDDMHAALLLCRQLAKAFAELPSPLTKLEQKQSDNFRRMSKTLFVVNDVIDKMTASGELDKLDAAEREMLPFTIVMMLPKEILE
jgi:hypothetical protein